MTASSPEGRASGNGGPGAEPNVGIVVVGGGMAGITAAIEAAEAGHEVFLLEREATLGGRVARMNQYFPKLCPPGCGLEINFRRIKQNHLIKVLTMAEVKAIEGEAGCYTVRVELAPRFVRPSCTACDKCVAACPVERVDELSYGIGKTKAIYLPHQTAYPAQYVIDPAVCPGESCSRCLAYCPYDAIDLAEKPRQMVLRARSVIVATGWKPYDARRLEKLSFGRLENVVTSTMLERMASSSGPTAGKIVRPSDGKPIRRVAFVQCAGSRDDNHLPYCSSVCCAATLKQTGYIREQYPEAEIHVFYIDIRTLGTLEDFYARMEQNGNIQLHRGKVARIERIPEDYLVVVAEDTLTGERIERVVDIAVLATGIQPEASLGPAVPYDAHGFVVPAGRGGVHGAGCARRPGEVAAVVQDATAAALRAIQSLRN